MSLSEQDVRKLALLARLELTDEEVTTLGPQLENILGFVEKLSELDTTDVEPMTTALDVDNRWREDEIVAGLSREDALRNAPSSDDACFLVPPVLGTAAVKK
jgi:aspartyl-tRNA(Asn)/glutamyl-tRNA(Gln) amidotransferase subunit C